MKIDSENSSCVSNMFGNNFNVSKKLFLLLEYTVFNN